jgi:hypothetical protein
MPLLLRRERMILFGSIHAEYGFSTREYDPISVDVDGTLVI